MARLFANPFLTDYFTALPEVRADSDPASVPSIVEQYEAGKVMSLPNLKIDIDYDFWGSLPTDTNKVFTKLKLRNDECHIDRKIWESEVDKDLLKSIQLNAQDIYRQILPLYHALFKGYTFTKKVSTCRIKTIVNKDMHFDTYGEDNPDHFARMFINLDNQPRIWHTGYTVQEIFDLVGGDIPLSDYETMSNNDLWSELRWRAFLGSKEKQVWWDRHPRHVAFFDPGDVWIVDSRQISHQIFYGRRALSIDFSVDVNSMIDPQKYYLNILADFRRRALQGDRKAEPALA
jgi:hypothetical protein